MISEPRISNNKVNKDIFIIKQNKKQGTMIQLDNPPLANPSILYRYWLLMPQLLPVYDLGKQQRMAHMLGNTHLREGSRRDYWLLTPIFESAQVILL